MKKTINFRDFRGAFEAYGRKDNFSYDGLEALFDYLEEYEESTGVEMELDVIAICCDFSEYENIEEFREDYGDEYETIEDIEYETLVIPVGDEGFIIQQF